MASRHVTNEEYDRLFEQFGGVCGICGAKPKRLRKDGTPYRLHVDHEHGTKPLRVRGLLCYRCNRALPNYVTTAWLMRAVAYLSPEFFDALFTAEPIRIRREDVLP